MTSTGLQAGSAPVSLTRFLYAKALLTLCQAKSTVRRLIVIAAHAPSLRGVTPRWPFGTSINFEQLPSPALTCVPSFQPVHPLKMFGREAQDCDALYSSHANGLSASTNAPICATALTFASLGVEIRAGINPQTSQASGPLLRPARSGGQTNAAATPITHTPQRAARFAQNQRIDAVLTECHLLAIYARERRNSS
jgi:hypothetical protein